MIPDHDRLDRIERKVNRIGRFVLFGIALAAVLAAIVGEPYYNRLVFGYGDTAAATAAVIVLAFFLWARTPFRD